jgi:transposase
MGVMSVLPVPPEGCGGCADRDMVIAAQAAQIAAQAAEVRDLRERLGRLERLVASNSGNSSFPPSMDGQPGRKRRAPRPRREGGTAKRPGKQPGAPGASLGWRDDPDERVPVRPAGRCGCGADLAGAADLGTVASHQQVDIPLVTARVTQYDLHAARCACGRAAVAARPPGLGLAGTVTYGPNLQAWCVYLMAAHAVPVHRCAELAAALAGAAPSPGFVHGLLARAAAAVAPANRLIRSLVIWAGAVSCDETTVRAGPGPSWRRRYLLVAATPLLTCYAVGDRDAAAFARFVLPDLTGTVVHDRYQVYDHKSLGTLTHQLCCAHLLRDLQAAAEAYPASAWPAAAAAALRHLIHAANRARDQGLPAVPPQTASPLAAAFRGAVAAGLAEMAAMPRGLRKNYRQPCQKLLEDLRDRENDVLRFTTDLRIPPTSNQAERDLRPAKTQDKISGRLRSETATRHRYAIRGYLSTAAKHHTDTLTALRDALLGTPWMPPIPDTALNPAQP